MLTTHPLPVLRLRKSRHYTLSLPKHLHSVCSGTTLPFTCTLPFYILIIVVTAVNICTFFSYANGLKCSVSCISLFESVLLMLLPLSSSSVQIVIFQWKGFTSLFSVRKIKSCWAMSFLVDVHQWILGNDLSTSLTLTPWHYSPDGRKPPLIRFHSLIQCICGASG
jgi:hypothetical protein